MSDEESKSSRLAEKREDESDKAMPLVNQENVFISRIQPLKGKRKKTVNKNNAMWRIRLLREEAKKKYEDCKKTNLYQDPSVYARHWLTKILAGMNPELDPCPLQMTNKQIVDNLCVPLHPQCKNEDIRRKTVFWYTALTRQGRDARNSNKENKDRSLSLLECQRMLFEDVETPQEGSARYLRVEKTGADIQEVLQKRANFPQDQRQQAEHEIQHALNALKRAWESWLIERSYQDGDNSVVSSLMQVVEQHQSLSKFQEQQKLEKEKSLLGYSVILNAVYDEVRKYGFVRIDGKVYKPIYWKGMLTHAYEPVHIPGRVLRGDVHQFLRWLPEASGVMNDTLRSLVMNRPGTLSSLTESVVNGCNDDRFPIKVMNRYYHAFTNSIWAIHENKWIVYGSPEYYNLPLDLACCKFYPSDFDYINYSFICERRGPTEPGWMDLECEFADRIPNTQEHWSIEEKQWWYIGIGRMLFELGKFDNWQKMWLHMGRSGAGKTTTLKFIMHYIPFEKIAILANNIEKGFGLEIAIGAYAWFGIDVDEKWSLDRAVWNTLIDGGLLALARKYRLSQIVDWDLPGSICANKVPLDGGMHESFKRRVLLLFYQKAPHKIDPHIYDKFAQSEIEVPMFLMKCVSAYKWALYNYGALALDNGVLPPNMLMSMQALLIEMDPLKSFLEDASWVECTPMASCSYAQFVASFKRYIRNSKTAARKYENAFAFYNSPAWANKNLHACQQLEDWAPLMKLKIANRENYKDLESKKIRAVISNDKTIITGMRLIKDSATELPVILDLNKHLLGDVAAYRASNCDILPAG